MDRARYEAMLTGPASLDYELYLKTDQLLSCQKPYDQLCNSDELQFQIVHQVEELWMKLMVHSLLDAIEAINTDHAHKALTLMGRVQRLLWLMSEQLGLLETMSPHDYQSIRLQLGNGSGQESPGFRVLMKLPYELWEAFSARYLKDRSIGHIYDHGYAHDEAYKMAEALMEFDESMARFRSNHMMLIHRSIGMGAQSLKGRSVELLESGMRHRFFPELWDIRCQMTDRWGGSYGRVRASLSDLENGDTGDHV
jgi:tryptophan 2,3-dioxygenase